MEKKLTDITLKDLPEDSYIIRIPDKYLDEGYTYIRGIVDNIKKAFPRKEFVWVPGDVEIKENEQS